LFAHLAEQMPALRLQQRVEFKTMYVGHD
jgi:hypothetical protein